MTNRQLPEGWRQVLLSTLILDVRNGLYKPDEYYGSGTPILKMFNIGNLDGMWKLDRVDSLELDDDEVEKYRLELGDILLCRVNSRELVGKCAVVDATVAGAVYESKNMRVRLDRSQADPNFVTYWINSDFGRHQIEGRQKQIVGQSTLNRADIDALLISLPLLEEQQRIAAEIQLQTATIEQARAAAQCQLDAAEELMQAYLREVFESEEAQGWEIRRIGDYAKVQSGFAFKSEWYTDSGVRLLRNANVFQGYLDWADVVFLPEDRYQEFENFQICEGDIILTLDRPIVKSGLKVARVTADDLPCLLVQRVGRFQLTSEIEAAYLYTFLNSPKFISGISGHDFSLAVPHISPLQVESVELPVPPLELQREISNELARRAKQIDEMLAGLQEQLTIVEKLPALILKQAFEGKL